MSSSWMGTRQPIRIEEDESVAKPQINCAKPKSCNSIFFFHQFASANKQQSKRSSRKYHWRRYYDNSDQSRSIGKDTSSKGRKLMSSVCFISSLLRGGRVENGPITDSLRLSIFISPNSRLAPPPSSLQSAAVFFPNPDKFQFLPDQLQN